MMTALRRIRLGAARAVTFTAMIVSLAFGCEGRPTESVPAETPPAGPAEPAGQATLDEQIEAGNVRVEGDEGVLRTFVGLLDDFELWFNIVTP